MRITIRIFTIMLLGSLILSSCVPNSKMVYMQKRKDDVGETTGRMSAPTDTQPVRVGDELYIRINSMDDYTSYYNMATEGGYYARADVSLVSYTVEDNGTVYLPMIGSVVVSGLTLEEAGKKITERYKGYLNQPAVNERFAAKMVTVLGEVGLPGVYTFTRQEIPVFEALGYAGDMTVYANRNKVMLIREEDNIIHRYRLDLTHPDLLESKYYYIQPNDVIYVQPLARRVWGFAEMPFALILTSISTLILMLSYIQQ